MTGRSPTTSKQGIVGKGFPIEVYNVLGAGDAFMSGFLRGWLQGRAASRPRATWANACGAFAVSRLLCAPEYPTWTELQLFPRARQHGARAAQGRGAQPHPLGDDAARRDPAADGARHRSSQPARSDAPGATPEKHRARSSVLAVKAATQVARRPAGLRHAARRQIRPRRAVRRRRRRRTSGSAKPIELPGSRPLRFEFTPGPRQPAGRMAGRPLHQGAVLLSPGRSGGAEGRADRQAARGLRRGAQGRPRAADRDHRRQGTARSTTTTIARGARPSSTTPGSSPTGGSSSRRRARARLGGDRRRRSRRATRYCRGVVLLGLDAPQDDLARGFRRRAAARDGQGLCRRPHDLRARRRAALARRQRSTTTQAVADMARSGFGSADRRCWQRLRADAGDGLMRKVAQSGRRSTMTHHPPDHGAGAGAVPDAADDG